jgi:hypothetical protein
MYGHLLDSDLSLMFRSYIFSRYETMMCVSATDMGYILRVEPRPDASVKPSPHGAGTMERWNIPRRV